MPKPQKVGPKKVAVYTRVSTTDKGQETSNQEQAIEQFTDNRSWSIEHWYTDQDSGGKPTRKGFQEMMKAARLGKFDCLVFWSLDRFSREGTYETLDHLKRLDGYGVQFISIQEEYLNTLGPFREAVIGILAAVAQMERQRISERVKAGMARAKAEGKVMGRPVRPIDQNSLVRMVRDNWSLTEIAKALDISRATAVRRRREVYEADDWPGTKLE